MAIRFGEPSDGLMEAAKTALAEGIRNESFRIRPPIGAKSADLGLSHGHPIATVGLQDVLEKRGVDSLTVSAWRFLIGGSETPAAALEMMVGVGGEPPRIVSVNAGPFVDSTSSAISYAAKCTEAGASDFEVRMVRVPGLYMMALWLHSANAEPFFVVLEPAPPGVEARHSYRWDDLVEALKGPAQERLKSTIRPRRTGS